MLSNIRIVLVETTHPGNIGAVARAMKAMALERLYLVNPKLFPSAEATARASGADDVLANAQVRPSLAEALRDCHLIVGTSARDRTVAWPHLPPRPAARRLLEEARRGPVALVFGRESSGLSNQELDLCQYLTHIPTHPGFSSLNVAAAVQLLAYELYQASLGEVPDTPPEEARTLATSQELEGFHQHLAQTLAEIGFAHPGQSTQLLRRLRRLFQRARPDSNEINILRGILSTTQGWVRRGTPPERR